MKPDFFPKGMPLSKRLFDLFCTIPGLVILSPFLLSVAILILVLDGWPVFFLQDRPGYRGKIFQIIKFRTMKVSANVVSPDEDAGRISRLGHFLRATSVDELPELFNVLRGEMSLVGPRPLLVQYIDRYTPEQARRHDVLPGMAGWAQVNGRNLLTWEKKFEYDVWYVDHWSFWLDIRILWITMIKVIKREGITQKGSATVEEFKGR
jgi:lipopolysaccharide/colanic/teichoic acid biosynthesis glycosyltransferase